MTWLEISHSLNVRQSKHSTPTISILLLKFDLCTVRSSLYYGYELFRCLINTTSEHLINTEPKHFQCLINKTSEPEKIGCRICGNKMLVCEVKIIDQLSSQLNSTELNWVKSDSCSWCNTIISSCSAMEYPPTHKLLGNFQIT